RRERSIRCSESDVRSLSPDVSRGARRRDVSNQAGDDLMELSRRKAIGLSGATLAGMSLSPLRTEALEAQAAQTAADAAPDSLVGRPMRAGSPAPLPLMADGSAPEHMASEAGAISDPLMWKTKDKEPPAIEFDYRKMAIKVDTRGMA